MTYLDKERQQATFDSEKLASIYITYQGKPYLQRWREIQSILAKDPILRFDPTEMCYSRLESLDLAYRRSARLHELFNLNNPELIEIYSIIPQQIPTSIHNIMLLPTIENLGNDKQKKKFLSDAYDLKIIGCYCQTELGHGSDVQSLETTATYDPSTEEFIISSLTVSSTKWWPGDLGLTATHAATHAQLYIKGRHFGIQTFIIPIRSLATHEPLPGITVGDIGPKLGYSTKDNGYLRFNNVRIPRENMLMKYAKVSKSGEFSKPSNDKVGYATMMFVRNKLIRGAYQNLSMGAVIAARYSAFRKQFKNTDGKEQVILDYQLQQNKIISQIANCYAMNATSKKIDSMY